jgi:glycerol-3-phosphate O-acyltransferase
VIGPDISHRRNLVKGLVTTHWCARPSRRGRAREHPLAKAKAQALRYGNEIASDYTYTAIRFLEVVLSWFWNKIYDGIKVNHIEQVQGIAQGHEVIYVPCHRSHIDYLLLSYLLFRNGLTPPHIAAGINLNMPVIGGLLRRGGAFFMRRTFKGNPLYTSVFNEYLHTLFTKGFPVEYFVEGGRSRTGRMLQPKPGCWRSPCAASCVRRARRSCSCRCTSATSACWKAAPTWANCAARARRKSRSSTSSRSSAPSSSALARCVNFGEPIKLAGFLDEQQPGWREQELARSTARTGSTTPPPPGRNRGPPPQRSGGDQPGQPGGPGAAVHQPPGPGRARPDPRARPVPGAAAPGALLAAHHLARRRRQALIKHAGMDLLAEQKDALGRILYLDEANAVLMTYYRNNVLHIFALPALLASFFQSSSRMSRELLGQYTRRCTRTCRPSCSCAGRPSNWTR